MESPAEERWLSVFSRRSNGKRGVSHGVPRPLSLSLFLSQFTTLPFTTPQKKECSENTEEAMTYGNEKISIWREWENYFVGRTMIWEDSWEEGVRIGSERNWREEERKETWKREREMWLITLTEKEDRIIFWKRWMRLESDLGCLRVRFWIHGSMGG